MKSITLCLLVLVSASCLLSANARTANPDVSDFENVDFSELEALLDSQEDYASIEEFGFCRSVRLVLRKALKSLRGVNCIVKEVTNILTAATDYVDAVDACTTSQVPKDVLAIVKSMKTIIGMCNNIIHLNRELCNTDGSDSDGSSSKKCFMNVFKAVMKLTRKLNTTIKQCTKLPKDTSTCYVDATDKVVASFNQFLPNIDKCVASM